MIRCKFALSAVLALAIVSLFARTADAQATPTFTPGNIVVSLASEAYANKGQIVEFTSSGGLVQSISVNSPASPGELPRSVAVAPDGTLYLYNGTFVPWLSYYKPAEGTWTNLSFAGWSTVNNVTYGGIATLGNYAYVTSMDTADGSENGIIRFNVSSGVGQRFESGTDFISLCLGWDGLLYAIEDEVSTIVHVYDPATMNPVRTFTLPPDQWSSDAYRSIAVDKNGQIFVVGLGGTVYHYDPNGSLVNSLDLGQKYATNLALSSSGSIAVTNENGFVYTSDETLSTYSSFKAYNELVPVIFVTFVPFQRPASLTIEPSTVLAGTRSTGTITLSGNASTGGAAVQITSSNTSVVPNASNVTVPAGKASTTFPVTTKSVTTPTTVTLTATYKGSSTTATLTVNPDTVSTFTVSPNPITGSLSATGTIELAGAAPSGGQVVSLSSSDPKAAPIGSSVTVAAGATSASFPIPTNYVTSKTAVKLTATLNGSSASATLNLTPYTIITFKAAPSPISGGLKVTATIGISAPAPPGGALIKLASNNTALSAPASVTIAAGKSTTTVTLMSKAVTSNQLVQLSAAVSGDTAYTYVTVVPTALTSFTVSPTTITGGFALTGTVNLTAAAPAGGAAVALATSSQAAVPIISSVTVPAGKSTASFSITTKTVTANQQVTLTATLNGSDTAKVTVVPAAISMFTVSPTSVQGGTTVTGTLTLNTAAPPNGITVTLTSSNRSAVPIVASDKIPAGKTSQTFTIITDKVAANANVTLAATLNGTATANLTVTH